MELFGMVEDSRKREGRKVVVNPKDAQQKSEVSLEAFPVLEAAIVKMLIERKLIESQAYEKPKETPKQEAARV
jgi:hypothetical protein